MPLRSETITLDRSKIGELARQLTSTAMIETGGDVTKAKQIAEDGADSICIALFKGIDCCFKRSQEKEIN